MAGVKMAYFESHWVNVARRNIKCDTFGVTKSVAFYIELGCNSYKLLLCSDLSVFISALENSAIGCKFVCILSIFDSNGVDIIHDLR